MSGSELELEWFEGEKGGGGESRFWIGDYYCEVLTSTGSNKPLETLYQLVLPPKEHGYTACPTAPTQRSKRQIETPAPPAPLG
jgi:hypothetical protein